MIYKFQVISHVYIVDMVCATTILQPFFRDYPCEPVPEENFWTLWCKWRL